MRFNVSAPQWTFSLLRWVEKAAAYGQGKGYGSGTVNQEVALIASQLSKFPRLAIDIGGHGGSYTKALRKRFPGLEVHIFEPSMINIAKLQERLGRCPGVVINRAAVSDTEGEDILFSDKPGSGLASLHKRKLDHYGMNFNLEEKVPTIAFYDYWATRLHRRPIDILKMDIEGHELRALSGFGEALSHIQVVQFEFGGTNIDSRTYFQDFFYFFSDAGFTLWRITPIGLEKIRSYREADEFFFTINYLAVNRRAHDAQ